MQNLNLYTIAKTFQFEFRKSLLSGRYNKKINILNKTNIIFDITTETKVLIFTKVTNTFKTYDISAFFNTLKRKLATPNTPNLFNIQLYFSFMLKI